MTSMSCCLCPIGERSSRRKPRQRKLVGEVRDLKVENQQLREMLIQNGLFMRITHGLHELGLEAPKDMKDKTLFSAAKNFRATLDSQIPQAHKLAKVWTERGSRIADQERRTHHCLEVNQFHICLFRESCIYDVVTVGRFRRIMQTCLPTDLTVRLS